jgi:hypothetical protein
LKFEHASSTWKGCCCDDSLLLEGRKLLFAGFIGLTFDKSHDIVVRVERNKILLFILHKTSKGLIVRDIATGHRGLTSCQMFLLL